MKKILIPTALFMGFMLASCSAEDEPKNLTYRENSQPETSEIIEEIQEVNSRYGSLYNGVPSRGFLRGLALISADAIGAYEGSKVGGAVGAVVGSAFAGAGAAPGAGVGAVIGGAIGGIGASYGMWCTTKGCGGIESTSMLNITSAYCAIKGDMESEDEDFAFAGSLNFPSGVSSLEELGVIHNGALEMLMYSGGGNVMPLGNELVTPEVPEQSDYQLSALEIAVLESDEYVSYYETSAVAISEGTYGIIVTPSSSLTDRVLKLYLDALGDMDNPDNDTVVNFTNEYIAIVADSNELNEEDKQSLYIAFSVAVYSYMYWAENY